MSRYEEGLVRVALLQAVAVEVHSKKSDCEFVTTLRQNYAEMKRKDRLVHSHERHKATAEQQVLLYRHCDVLIFLCQAKGQFTAVNIVNVDLAFFEDFSANREAFLRTFADKYCFYIHGLGLLPPKLTNGNDAGLRVKLVIDGVSLRELPGEQSKLVSLVEAAKKHKVPIWEKKVKIAHEGTTALAQLVLFYFPALNGVESMPLPDPGSVNPEGDEIPLTDREPGLLTLWQDLFLAGDALRCSLRNLTEVVCVPQVSISAQRHRTGSHGWPLPNHTR